MNLKKNKNSPVNVQKRSASESAADCRLPLRTGQEWERVDEPTVDSVHSNPHLRQVDQANCVYESGTNIEFNRLLLPDAPGQEYRQRQGESKTMIHWGQRKLLLSEIEFLTKFSVPGATVLYAGAAPGTHTLYLIELFPELKFVLVDPAPFSNKLKEGPQCLLRQEFFTD